MKPSIEYSKVLNVLDTFDNDLLTNDFHTINFTAGMKYASAIFRRNLEIAMLETVDTERNDDTIYGEDF